MADEKKPDEKPENVQVAAADVVTEQIEPQASEAKNPLDAVNAAIGEINNKIDARFAEVMELLKPPKIETPVQPVIETKPETKPETEAVPDGQTQKNQTRGGKIKLLRKRG